MNLQSDSIDTCRAHVVVHQRGYLVPLSFRPFFKEEFVDGQARIALDTDVLPIPFPIENDRFNDAAICQDRAFQFVETCAALTLIVSRSAESQIYLLCSRLLPVNFQKLSDSRVFKIQLNVLNRDCVESASRVFDFSLHSRWSPVELVVSRPPIPMVVRKNGVRSGRPF